MSASRIGRAGDHHSDDDIVAAPAHMPSSTMIRKIATAAVYVEDQQQALEFWTTQVGFEVHAEKSMGPQARWIEVGPPGAETCLVLYPRSMMHDWSERKPSIVFETADVRRTFEELRSRGVQFTQEPTDMPWGPFAMFVDRDGNSYGLREPV
jgi:predicted enzyme related to lactoylglutathione lyase